MASATQPTLQSSLQAIQIRHAPFEHAPHPFSSSSESSLATLRDLAASVDSISHSLNAYLSTPLGDPKLVSLLRQYSSISSTLHASEQNVHQTIEALRKGSGTIYGEDIPLDRHALSDWCLSRLLTWGKSVGLEAFRDDGRAGTGKATVLLAGKVLVVEFEFAILEGDDPRIDVASVKTAYAMPTQGVVAPSPTEGCASLDGFLEGCFRRFCVEVQKGEEMRDQREAARLGKTIVGHLAYLVMLDKLAQRKGDGGTRWFVEIDKVSRTAEGLAKKEADAVSSSSSTGNVPLDIFLLRAHALPLPFLTTPSISFLAYLSPLAYLTLLRSSPQPLTAPGKSPTLPNIDIPFSHLRSRLQTHPRMAGATVATLSLVPTPHDRNRTEASGIATDAGSTSLGRGTRPAYALISSQTMSAMPTADTFPQTIGQDIKSDSFGWILDFTEGGKYPGVMMSQSRMREIELAVRPRLSYGSDMNSVRVMSFGTRSWVNLLLSPSQPIVLERYTTLYRSPSSAHPPLQIRLTAPPEPGFVLETVRVTDLKQVHAVLEVVREQCWLNEILGGCQWAGEGLGRTGTEEVGEEGADSFGDVGRATEEELRAVLDGTFTPHQIPVNLYIPSPSTVETALDAFAFTTETSSSSLARSQRPRLILTSPERPPIPGTVEVTVTLDESRPRGVSVKMRGAMMGGATSELGTDRLEEVCRRGGVLGLCGRIWEACAREGGVV